jgi:hypothetical protein
VTEKPKGAESRVNTAALYLSASFLVVLGTINIVHNFIPLFRGAGGSWWPVILGMIAFGLLPLGFGCWLVWRHDDRKGNGRD